MRCSINSPRGKESQPDIPTLNFLSIVARELNSALKSFRVTLEWIYNLKYFPNKAAKCTSINYKQITAWRPQSIALHAICVLRAFSGESLIVTVLACNSLVVLSCTAYMPTREPIRSRWITSVKFRLCYIDDWICWNDIGVLDLKNNVSKELNSI